MTSATVTQLGEMITNISGNTGNLETQTGEFAGIFQTAADKSESSVKPETEKVKTTATEKNMSVSKTAEKLRETKAEVKANEPKDMEAVEKELEETAEELKSEIAKKLDITVEELEAVMETLGLTNASLFTQDGMTALVMEAEQIATPVELLTNADVYQTLQELNAVAAELLNEVKDEYQLTDVQMQDALEQFAVTEENVVDIEDADAIEITEETDSVRVSGIEENGVTTDKALEEANLLKEATNADRKETEAGNKDSGHNASDNQQFATNGNTQFNNTKTVNQATDFSGNIPGENVSAQEIYDQIGEYIKTQVKPGISEVEMQLNPEHLGSLHIRLSSRQGNVTAQFVVQNEAVRAAVEMQMIQLKENFAEQGIKVDAVEVTVESHAFNQNMQQSNEQNAQAEAQARKASPRSINLSNDNWAEEELTEEEQLVAEMMEANGNTVDYMA